MPWAAVKRAMLLVPSRPLVEGSNDGHHQQQGLGILREHSPSRRFRAGMAAGRSGNRERNGISDEAVRDFLDGRDGGTSPTMSPMVWLISATCATLSTRRWGAGCAGAPTGVGRRRPVFRKGSHTLSGSWAIPRSGLRSTRRPPPLHIKPLVGAPPSPSGTRVLLAKRQYHVLELCPARPPNAHKRPYSRF